MKRPVIALPADTKIIDHVRWHAVTHQYIEAAVRAAGLMPLIVPALEEGGDIEAVLDRVDGVLIPGAASNVHPSLYGELPAEGDGPFDPARDATSLPLIRAAIARGIPLLAICRGLQELNVALGGTLAREIQDMPGIWDHRTPESETRDDKYAIRQSVSVKENSCMARILGSGTVAVNSLHRQAISATAPRLAIEALAEDGTVEAVSVIDAPGFAVGVQWHPEYWALSDGPSRAIFTAFGEAVRAYAASVDGKQAAAE